MTAELATTGKMLSPGPMFSKAGDFGILVHSYFIIVRKVLSTIDQVELRRWYYRGESGWRRIEASKALPCGNP